MTAFVIPVHVACEPPDRWNEIEQMQREAGDSVNSWLSEQHRPEIAYEGIDWLDLEPRWLGFEAADCSAALQPSTFHGRGASEFARFRQGAQSRGEIAIAISRVGSMDDGPRSVLSRSDGGVTFPGANTYVASERVGKDARVRQAAGLGAADADLALRLINCPTPLAWRALTLHGNGLESWQGREAHELEGTLHAIVESELGEPVAAAWVSPDGVARHYVVPIETPWDVLLRWLTEQALPEMVPGVLRRARRGLKDDPSLMTLSERRLRKQIDELDARQRAERNDMERALEAASSGAEQVRHDLLYGSGKTLVYAVRHVLEFAGISVVDLDELLGEGVNADLLCRCGERSRLVEVRSAGGNAAERSYQDLIRHMREWSSLPQSTPVDGGALVISHQIRLHPSGRVPAAYGRREFLAAATEPIITAVDLFNAWRDEDRDTIQTFLFGSASHGDATPSSGGGPVTSEQPSLPDEVGRQQRRGWRRMLPG